MAADKRRGRWQDGSQDRMPAQKLTERPGLVIASHGALVEVEDATGKTRRCALRRKIGTVVCGDKVIWAAQHGKDCVVTKLLPRARLLSRPDARGRMRPLASHVDCMVVVSAVQPPPDTDLIDRYLVAAELLGITPVLLLNKVDLLDTDTQATLTKCFQPYQSVGYQVVYASATQAHGLDDLVQHLRNRTSILVGQSGVGKSSLVNSLLPQTAARVGQLSSGSGLGTHTTSAVRLYHLPQGGDLIDSPGVREFGLWPVTARELVQGFIEFRDFVPDCRFHNCRHLAEPGCAVAAAAASGQITQRRLDSYRRILTSLPQSQH